MVLFKNIAAQNLIANGSFELNTSPVCNGDFNVSDWISLSTPNYYHNSCSSSGFGVPTNVLGYSIPIEGNAYGGINVYFKPYEVKEYIQQHLSLPLVWGKSYYVSFYVSRVENFTMAIKNIGAYFSVAQPTVVSVPYITATPQIQNQTGFLSDTTVWTKIEGYFVAQGGEEYITIGNFNSNADTDTLYIGSNNPLPSNPDGAYYYIDSVSLYDALNMPTGISEKINAAAFVVYPNPANDMIHVEFGTLKDRENLQIKIIDVLGRETLVSEYKEQLDISHLEKGIYFLSVYKNNTHLGTKKIVRE